MKRYNLYKDPGTKAAEAVEEVSTEKVEETPAPASDGNGSLKD